MPFYRVPGRVKAFRKWAQEKVDSAELSDSATPSKVLGRNNRYSKSRRRRRRKLRKKKVIDG